MITKPTVFILGAGASVPYGYPTGWKLRKLILDGIQTVEGTGFLKGNELFEAHEALNLTEIFGDFLDFEKLLEFRNNFKGSKRSSIDAFLENRTEFCSIGKKAIAKEIIWLEKEHKDINDKWDWFEHVHDSELARGCNCAEDYGANEINVITFNYDRSFEHLLMNAFKHTFRGNGEEFASIINENFKVIHVHGQLDKLPWEDNKTGREYGKLPSTPEEWNKSSEGIKIIHESKGEKTFKEAQALLENAEMIVFLGLNLYNTTNLSRLNIQEYINHKNIYGTMKGLTESQIGKVATYFNQKLINAKNLDDIRRYGQLDSLNFINEIVMFR